MKKYALVAFNVAFVALSVCYPFVLYFGEYIGIKHSISIIMCALCFVWGIKAFLGFRAKNGFWILSAIFSALFVLLFLQNQFLQNPFNSFGVKIAYFYPVAVYILLLVAFVFSLKDEAIITKFAVLSHGAKCASDLPKEVQSYLVPYTRILTKIWASYFGFCAVVAFVLACFEDKFLWSVFCGGICYVALGLLFGIEWIYRYMYVIPRQHPTNLKKGLDNV